MACRRTASVNGPFGDFGDSEGYRAAARRAAVLGYEGKWAIHPSQRALANEVFTPTPEQIGKSRRVVEAMTRVARQGLGAVLLDGRLIDIASIRMAQALLAKSGSIPSFVDSA